MEPATDFLLDTIEQKRADAIQLHESQQASRVHVSESGRVHVEPAPIESEPVEVRVRDARLGEPAP
jgi:hypothetical protein